MGSPYVTVYPKVGLDVTRIHPTGIPPNALHHGPRAPSDALSDGPVTSALLVVTRSYLS